MTKIFPLLHIKEERRKKEDFMGISPPLSRLGRLTLQIGMGSGKRSLRILF